MLVFVATAANSGIGACMCQRHYQPHRNWHKLCRPLKSFCTRFSYRCERTFWGGSVCLTALKQVKKTMLFQLQRQTFSAKQVWFYHEYIYCSIRKSWFFSKHVLQHEVLSTCISPVCVSPSWKRQLLYSNGIAHSFVCQFSLAWPCFVSWRATFHWPFCNVWKSEIMKYNGNTSVFIYTHLLVSF